MYLAYLTNFTNLNGTLNIRKDQILEFSKNFEKIYFINSQNLHFFPNFAKKFHGSPTGEQNNKIIHSLPRNIIFINPSDVNDFKNFINNEKILIINNIGRGTFALKIHYLIKKFNLKQVYIDNLGSIGMYQYFPLKNIIKKIIFFLFTTLGKKLVPILAFLNIISRIEVNFISNKKILQAIKNHPIKNFLFKNKFLFSKEFKLVNSRSYDFYLKKKLNISEKYIVHLDPEMNGNHEIEVRGRMDEKIVKKHYKNLRLFLKNLSKLYKKPVVVCKHPSISQKEIKRFKKANYFKDFKITQFKTREYIYRAALITNFDTSAVIDAPILKKKIIGLWSNFLDENQIEHSKTYPREIGYPRINYVKNINISKKKLEKMFKNSKKNYKKYISNFHCFNSKISGTDEIIKILKKRFKCK